AAASPVETEGTLQARRYEHYEVMLDADGRPIELGRGAMGATYKALDAVSSPRYRSLMTFRVTGQRRSTRLRFLREARAAASVRHPNVASVFHLGRTRKNYFYAMEFVDAMPVYFARRCTKFTFREFNVGVPALQLRFLEQQCHCSLF